MQKTTHGVCVSPQAVLTASVQDQLSMCCAKGDRSNNLAMSLENELIMTDTASHSAQGTVQEGYRFLWHSFFFLHYFQCPP